MTICQEHCVDCCCARSWTALGVTEYDGRSIPEHIIALRELVAELEREREARFILGMRAAAELVRGYGPARLDIIAAANKLERQSMGGLKWPPSNA